MADSLRPGKRLLVVSNNARRARHTARMLSALGYDTAVAEPASVLSCCQASPPDAAVVAGAAEEVAAVQEGLRKLKWLQQQGRLPLFPIISAGQPDGDTEQALLDGIVLEPSRLTSLAIEISKQMDGAATSAGPMAVDDDHL
jgi:CheY-like chemotaxis protein